MSAVLKPLPVKITHEIVSVSPALAAEWLERNTHNQPLKQSRVDQIAADMRAGRWTFNGEPIQFGRDGVLHNGQHRLWGVIESSTTQSFLVIRGLPPEAQLTMDQGLRRTPASQLILSGVNADNTVASAIRVYIQWTTMRFFGDQASPTAKITTSEVVQWAKQHPHLVEQLHELSAAGLRRLPVRPAVSLAVALRFSQIDREAAQVFFGSLISGADMSPASPRLALLNRLRRIKETGTRVVDRDLIGFFVVAWNAERRGRSMTKLQRPHAAGWTAATFPEPK